jgi:4-amino-4-deoxy-L-arabinose transferase
MSVAAPEAAAATARAPRRAGLSGALEHPWVALALIAAALLATAGGIGLIEPTETRYAEIAREMRATGDYLAPHLNGIPHYHKPPLAYWTIAGGFALLGENAWGARVPMTLCAIGMLALALIAAKRRFAALGIGPGLAIWTLGACVYFLAIGRSVASDPVLAVSVAGFWALAPSPWALMALGFGFLAKGPVVFLPTVLAILVAAAWGRDRGTLALLGPARGWIAFAMVALPWYLLMATRIPGLLSYLLGNQLWQRYASETHQRGGPPWYFVAVLLVGAMPWTPALIAGLARLWKERARPEARLLLCWLVVPTVFLSFSGSKLPAYVLPCFPAAALIAALGLTAGSRAVAWSGALLLALVAAAGAWFGPRALASAVGLPATQSVALPFSVGFGLVCLLYAATWLARAQPAPAGLLVVFGFAAMLSGLALYESPLGSPRPLARTLAEMRGPHEPVVEFKRFNAGLPFYLRENVRLLEVPRETGFAPRPPDPRVTRDSLPELAARGGRVWILGPPQESAEVAEALGLRYEKVTTWRKDALGTITR